VDQERLKTLLEEVRAGTTSVEKALAGLRTFPLDATLEYATLDTHRSLRTGFPEVVFCQGKSAEQCAGIAARLVRHSDRVLLTRATPDIAAAVSASVPEAVYHPLARCIVVGSAPSPAPDVPGVVVTSAGTSDLPVAEEAVVTLRTLGSSVVTAYDVGVAGLHRLLDKRSLLDGAACIVVVAGMEGALASVVGGLVSCPVIACPTSVGYGASFGGLAALLTMLNSCAAGVAVVNIDNGFGAGYIAHLIARGTRTVTAGGTGAP
jgi:NCAIR mutase (PurE)-related protein